MVRVSQPAENYLSNYKVSGITCKHCVNHVTEEVSALDGVIKVTVSLSGEMKVTSTSPLDFDAISEAVAEAGEYTVTVAN